MMLLPPIPLVLPPLPQAQVPRVQLVLRSALTSARKGAGTWWQSPAAAATSGSNHHSRRSIRWRAPSAWASAYCSCS